MYLQTWGDVIVFSLQNVWASVAAFVPLLVGAVVVFIIGWIVAVALGKLVEEIVKALKVDHLLSKLEIEKTLEKAGWRLNSGAFLGGLVRWFLLVVFLLAAANIVGLSQVSDFLTQVLLYLPNVVVAALILIIAAIVADVVERLVRGSTEAAGYRGSLVGVVARWSIWVLAFLAVLSQLGIVRELINTVVANLTLGLALAVGLAFGLGGKDTAAEFIQKVRGELRK